MTLAEARRFVDTPERSAVHARAPADRRIVRFFLIAWVIAGVIFALLAATPDVQRSQEVRVLATAREMLARGTLHDFLIPHLNDRPRLQKPPLAYWFTAASFAAFGVTEFAGRLPAVLATWFTAGVTFVIARRRFGDRAAAFAAAALLGSFLMLRFGALAETDAWTALFATIAIGAIWRCFELLDDPRRGQFIAWAHVSAVAIAGCALVKGPPAGYPAIFLLAAAAVTSRWALAGRWITSGAPLTALLLGVPWFVYASRSPEAGVLLDELEIIAAGGAHRRSFLRYFPEVLAAIAPWTGVMLLGLAAAIRQWRIDVSLRLTLIWFAATFVPLCFVGQKQKHYLMPAMPPLAILTGVTLARATRPTDDDRDDATAHVLAAPNTPERFVPHVLALTLGIGMLAVIGLPIAGYFMRGRYLVSTDFIIGCAITTTSAAALFILARRGVGRAAVVAALFGFPAVALTLFIWSPSADIGQFREVVVRIEQDERAAGRTLGYAFYEQYENLPTIWAMRRIVPALRTRESIAFATAPDRGDARPMLITTVKNPPAFPPGYAERHRVRIEDRDIVIAAPTP